MSSSDSVKLRYEKCLQVWGNTSLDEDSVGYFKVISEQVGIPYQSLINLYLRDCAVQNRKLVLRWK
jgi:hypothetical protein